MKTVLFLSSIIAIVCSAAVASAKPLKAAFVSAVSGSDPNTSLELKRGLEVFKKLEPISDSFFSIQSFDNKGDVQESVALARTLSAEGYDAILGLARSDEALAVAQVVKDKNLIFMTPFATNPKLATVDTKIIQVCYSDDLQGKALAQFALADLKVKRLLILVNSESLYSNGLANQFKSSFGHPSGVEIKELAYTERDLKSVEVNKLAEAFKPDVIFIPDHITRAALFAKALSKILPSTRFLGGDGFGGKKVLTGVFGDVANIDLYYTTHWHSDLKTAQNKKFVKTYRSMFPESEPTSGAALMFDLLNIYLRAARSGRRDPQEIAKFIRTQSFETTVGKTTFSREADQGASKPIVILHLKNHEYGLLKAIR